LARKEWDRAADAFRKALALSPRHAAAHANLGIALANKGQVDEAIASYRKAIHLEPGLAQAHFNLGIALMKKGRLDEAIASYREVTRLRPGLALAHYNLGNALGARGLLDQAIASYRKSIELGPNRAEAHCNLGEALKARGDFAEALGAFRRGHELGSKRGDWKYDSGAWARECEELVEREKKLLAVLAGQSQPADARECLEWARLCTWTRRYAAAARLSGQAFAAEGKLADDLEAGHRYRAAAAAARAGLGQGRDGGTLTDEARAALRSQALGWLKVDLAAWRGHRDGGRRARALKGWRADQALAGVRDIQGLAKLPPPERAAWGALWAEVDRALRPAR
jgi:tetratricopeptide (TPR) repeat protein